MVHSFAQWTYNYGKCGINRVNYRPLATHRQINMAPQEPPFVEVPPLGAKFILQVLDTWLLEGAVPMPVEDRKAFALK